LDRRIIVFCGAAIAIAVLAFFALSWGNAGEPFGLFGEGTPTAAPTAPAEPAAIAPTPAAVSPSARAASTPTAAAGAKTVRDLPITFAGGMDDSLVEYFNSIAREGDIIGFYEKDMGKPGFAQQVAKVRAGRANQNFASWRRAEENAAELKALGMDCMSYDLEKWENTPADEWADIENSSWQFARVAHDNGLCYIGGLSNQLAKQPGAIEAMAKYADVYGPHSHGAAKETPLQYADYLRDAAQRAKAGNPGIKIDIMVTTAAGSPDVQTIYGTIKECLDFADSVMIYHDSSADSVAKMKELIALMRA